MEQVRARACCRRRAKRETRRSPGWRDRVDEGVVREAEDGVAGGELVGHGLQLG